jgi:hypothetical protein
MTTNTDLIDPNLLPQELSRAQQSGRLGEAQHEHDALTRAYVLGYQLRLALGRLI